jgi:hypothetical protein
MSGDLVARAKERAERRASGRPTWREKAGQRRREKRDREEAREALRHWARLVERAESHRLKTYVKTDSEGNVLDCRRGHAPPPPGWETIESQKEMDEMLHKPLRIKRVIDPQTGQRVNGRKPVVRLTVDTTRFVADGVDQFQAMVVGVPAGMGPVRVLVNREEQLWDPGVVYGSTSTMPGERWSIELRDPRFFSEAPSVNVFSVAPLPAVPKGSQ